MGKIEKFWIILRLSESGLGKTRNYECVKTNADTLKRYSSEEGARIEARELSEKEDRVFLWLEVRGGFSKRAAEVELVGVEGEVDENPS